MINLFNCLKKIGLYQMPGLKGILYSHYSHKASRLTKDVIVNDSKYNENEIIVSLTTYGERTKTVHKTILSLINQKLRPQKIILWLDQEEFNDETLPDDLKFLKNKVSYFDICYCENLKPHKKYYYSMKKYPKNIIVTADDDVYYPSTWLNKLYLCYKKNKDCICCTNAHRIKLADDYSIVNYNSWDYLVPDFGPDILLCPIGVGGVLYPPNTLYCDVFDKQFIIDNCLNADDLWLKIMSLLNGVKVVHIIEFPYTFLSIDNTQHNALSKGNVINNKNDEQLANIMRKYGKQVKELLCKELSQ